MDLRPTELERAFQLARSGRPNSIDDIKLQLKKEHYSAAQITGQAIKKQLLALIQTARASQPAAQDGKAESA
jgi:hypothetical protein